MKNESLLNISDEILDKKQAFADLEKLSVQQGEVKVDFPSQANLLQDSVQEPSLLAQKASETGSLCIKKKAAGGKADLVIDPSTAIEVIADQTYSLSLAAGYYILLKINTDNMKKITAVIQFAAAVDVYTQIFTIDAQMNVTTIAESVNMFADTDNIAALPKGGWYYILFNVNAGGGDCAFRLVQSPSYGYDEPNDSPWQVSRTYTDELKVVDTFDSIYDRDCFLLNITAEDDGTMSKILLHLQPNGTVTNAKVNLSIYFQSKENPSQSRWILNGPITAPFTGLSWTPPQAGLYFIYLQAADNALVRMYYTFIMGKEQLVTLPTDAQVGNVTGAPDSGKFDGYYWANGHSCTIYGVVNGLVRGKNGYARTRIQVKIFGNDAEDVKSGEVYTDENASFKLAVSLPYTYGSDGYFQGSHYTHSFDVNTIYFYDDLGNRIPSNMRGNYILNVAD